MFCEYCGNKIDKSISFCPACGRSVSKINRPKQTASGKGNTIAIEEEKNKLGVSILTFSILGLVLSYTGIFPFLGLIFALISKANLENYSSKFGKTSGRATVGKYLGVVAMIVSIIMTATSLISFVAETIVSIIVGMLSSIISAVISNVVAAVVSELMSSVTSYIITIISGVITSII